MFATKLQIFIIKIIINNSYQILFYNKFNNGQQSEFIIKKSKTVIAK
jgi:hypothetical protein